MALNYNDIKQKRRVDPSNYWNMGRTKEVKCEFCGNIFKRNGEMVDYKIKDKHFCSWQCKSDYKKELERKEMEELKCKFKIGGKIM